MARNPIKSRYSGFDEKVLHTSLSGYKLALTKYGSMKQSLSR